LGSLGRDKTLLILKRAKLLLWFPILPETNGRVVVEALKLKVPVLGYKSGILHDLWKDQLAEPQGKDIVCAKQLYKDWPASNREVALSYIHLYRQILGEDNV